jgi:hypothetical protein
VAFSFRIASYDCHVAATRDKVGSGPRKFLDKSTDMDIWAQSSTLSPQPARSVIVLRWKPVFSGSESLDVGSKGRLAVQVGDAACFYRSCKKPTLAIAASMSRKGNILDPTPPGLGAPNACAHGRGGPHRPQRERQEKERDWQRFEIGIRSRSERK